MQDLDLDERLLRFSTYRQSNNKEVDCSRNCKLQFPTLTAKSTDDQNIRQSIMLNNRARRNHSTILYYWREFGENLNTVIEKDKRLVQWSRHKSFEYRLKDLSSVYITHSRGLLKGAG